MKNDTRSMNEVIMDYISEAVKGKKGENANTEKRLRDFEEYIDCVAQNIADGKTGDIRVCCSEVKYDPDGNPQGAFMGIPSPVSVSCLTDGNSILTEWEDGTFTEAVMDIENARTKKAAGFALTLLKKVFGKEYDEIIDDLCEGMEEWDEVIE